MFIEIEISNEEIKNIPQKKYDEYTSELRSRIGEVHPDSKIFILTSDNDVALCTVDGFHDNNSVHLITHEIQKDVFNHGYWRNNL